MHTEAVFGLINFTSDANAHIKYYVGHNLWHFWLANSKATVTPQTTFFKIQSAVSKLCRYLLIGF